MRPKQATLLFKYSSNFFFSFSTPTQTELGNDQHALFQSAINWHNIILILQRFQRPKNTKKEKKKSCFLMEFLMCFLSSLEKCWIYNSNAVNNRLFIYKHFFSGYLMQHIYIFLFWMHSHLRQMSPCVLKCTKRVLTPSRSLHLSMIYKSLKPPVLKNSAFKYCT